MTGKRPPPLRPVAVFHTGRCGSTVLERKLNQHPKIMADGEIFAVTYQNHLQNHRKITPQAFFDLHRSNITRDHPAKADYLFQVKYLSGLDMALFDGGLPAHLDFLHSRGTSHAIVLHRKNALRRLVSTRIAIERGRYHDPVSSSPEQVTVHFDADRVHLGGTYELTEVLALLETEHAALLDALKSQNIAVLDLTYEDHIEPNPSIATDRVLTFLNQPHMSLPTTLARVQTSLLSQTLRNYAQVAERLAGTRFEWMLQG